MLKRHIFSFLLILFSMLGSAPLLADNTAEPLLVSIKPLALLTKALLPQQVVHTLIPANRNLHDYALTVADLKKLQSHELLIWLGDQQEPFIAKLQPRLAGGKLWVAVAQGQSHPWLSRKQLPDLIDTLAIALVRANPARQAEIKHNSEQLKQAVEQRFDYWQQQLQAQHETPFLLGHSAFIAFARGLGLEHAELYRAGHSHGHSHGGMHELLDIQQQLANGKIRCALEEPDIHFDALKQRYPSLKLVRVSPMAGEQAVTTDGFVQFIDQTAQAIAACLTEQGP